MCVRCMSTGAFVFTGVFSPLNLHVSTQHVCVSELHIRKFICMCFCMHEYINTACVSGSSASAAPQQ